MYTYTYTLICGLYPLLFWTIFQEKAESEYFALYLGSSFLVILLCITHVYFTVHELNFFRCFKFNWKRG